jgi:hypothetical protein
LIKAGNRKNFTLEIVSIQREGKYAYQTGRWTLDQVKDNGEVTKVGEYRPYFEEQPDGKWLAKVHIYNVSREGTVRVARCSARTLGVAEAKRTSGASASSSSAYL